MKPASKWASLGERVAKLKDGESIVLEPKGNPAKEAHKIRNSLGTRVCISLKVAEGKIVIRRVGTGSTLDAFGPSGFSAARAGVRVRPSRV